VKILELRTENIKNLKVIEIRPDGAVILEGKNGAGKSAVLDSIFLALTGKKIEQPIRNGETRAEINVDLGEYRIRRIFTEKADRLEVLSKEGAAFKSPQTLLNSLFGDITFDPLAFANMKEKPQRELLAELVGLDFTELDAKRLDLYNERTIKNREIKGGDSGQYRDDSKAPLPLESLISKMEVPAPGTPRVEISLAEEISKVETLEDAAKKYKDFQEEQEATEKDIADNDSAIANNKKLIEELRQQIEDLEGIIENQVNKNKDLRSIKASTIAPMEVTDDQISNARASLRDIEEKNIAIRKAVEYDKKQAELKNAKEVIVKLESDMIKIDLEKDQKIKAAKFPIEGLGITDACVIYNGKPFSQLSTGEQIRVSTAIAMVLNSELKIILIREGSLLDTEGLKMIIEIAKDKDYQLWIERVADNQQIGIYLEDGEIK
jgi:energy-coupling factor transporter ATP-binding protein EcfA2